MNSGNREEGAPRKEAPHAASAPEKDPATLRLEKTLKRLDDLVYKLTQIGLPVDTDEPPEPNEGDEDAAYNRIIEGQARLEMQQEYDNTIKEIQQICDDLQGDDSTPEKVRNMAFVVGEAVDLQEQVERGPQTNRTAYIETMKEFQELGAGNDVVKKIITDAENSTDEAFAEERVQEYVSSVSGTLALLLEHLKKQTAITEAEQASLSEAMLAIGSDEHLRNDKEVQKQVLDIELRAQELWNSEELPFTEQREADAKAYETELQKREQGYKELKELMEQLKPEPLSPEEQRHVEELLEQERQKRKEQQEKRQQNPPETGATAA